MNLARRSRLSTLLALILLLLPHTAAAASIAYAQLAQGQCTISVAPTSITAGDRAVLSWTIGGFDLFFISVNAGTIDHGIGLVPSHGSRDIYPTETTTYGLAPQLSFFGFTIGSRPVACHTTITVSPGTAACTPTYTCAGNSIKNSCNGVVSPCANGASCVDGQCVQCGAVNVVPQNATCSKSFTTPGTYTYTVPSSLNFNGLTVTVNGAGGGGGSGSCSYLIGIGSADYCSGKGNGNGSAGGVSSFGSAVIGNGGGGGQKAKRETLFGPADSVAGLLGSASGGDTNTEGGGGSGGSGGKARSFLSIGGGTAGNGGNGGKAVKSYSPSTLTPGSTITVVVGSGGTGSSRGLDTGGDGRGLSGGGNGSDGSVVISCL